MPTVVTYIRKVFFCNSNVIQYTLPREHAANTKYNNYDVLHLRFPFLVAVVKYDDFERGKTVMVFVYARSTFWVLMLDKCWNSLRFMHKQMKFAVPTCRNLLGNKYPVSKPIYFSNMYIYNFTCSTMHVCKCLSVVSVWLQVVLQICSSWKHS